MSEETKEVIPPRVEQTETAPLIELNIPEPTLSVLKKLILHTLPIAADSLITASTDFGNAIILTKIGPDAVAANAYIFTIKNLILFPTSAIFYSLQPLLSRRFIENKNEESISIFRSSILLIVPISIVTGAILIPIGPFLKLVGQDPHLADLTARYFYYYMGSIPAALLIKNLLQMFLSTNNQILLLPASILRTTLGLGLGFGFVYGLKMGMAGVGLSALLEPWISLFLLSLGSKLTGRFDVFTLFKLNFPQEGKPNKIYEILRMQGTILRLGIPVGAQNFLEIGAHLINALFIGKQSKAALIAYNISGQWSYLIATLHSSLSISAAVLTSAYISQRKSVEIKKLKLLSLGVGLGISSVGIGIYSTLYKPLTLLLLNSASDQEAILNSSKIMFPIASAGALGFGFKYISSGISRGYEKTMVPMILDFAGTAIIGLALASLFTFVFNFGPNEIVLAELVGIIFAAITTTFYAYRLKQENSLISEDSEHKFIVNEESPRLVNNPSSNPGRNRYSILPPSEGQDVSTITANKILPGNQINNNTSKK
jgi:MATE family multidrug resistance protein